MSDGESENDVYVVGADLKNSPAKSQEGTPENQIAGRCAVGKRAAERSKAASFADPTITTLLYLMYVPRIGCAVCKSRGC